MKKLIAAALLLVAAGGTAYAAAPNAVHAALHACGLPCC
jgi:hypothetical protein